PACCSVPARSPGRFSSAGAWPASASGCTCTSATGRWSRWRSQARPSRCCVAPAGSSSLQAELTHEELGAALREHAYLEGDFVLRSGRRSRYYLDKYRFETRPDLLGPLGERIARAVAEHEPEAARLAGPELGAVPLAAAASLASGLPFLIVRKEAKEDGTGNRLEGVFEDGECVWLVED